MTKHGWQVALGVVCALTLAAPAAAQTGSPAPAPAPAITDTGSLSGPRQPIFFRHDVHAGQFKIPCLYCHYSVTVSSEPGIPAVQTCIGCHQVVGGSTPSAQAEIQKVRKAWSDRQAPEWTRIHAVPGFVRFPHQRHIKVLGSDACNTCHGEIAVGAKQVTVEAMPQIYQVQTLRMGWCIRCHLERKVTRDCTACHY